MMNLVVCHPFEAKPPTAEGILPEETFATRQGERASRGPCSSPRGESWPPGQSGLQLQRAHTPWSGVQDGSTLVCSLRIPGERGRRVV